MTLITCILYSPNSTRSNAWPTRSHTYMKLLLILSHSLAIKAAFQSALRSVSTVMLINIKMECEFVTNNIHFWGLSNSFSNSFINFYGCKVVTLSDTRKNIAQNFDRFASMAVVLKLWIYVIYVVAKSPVLHCASLLCIIPRVISARASKNSGLFFVAELAMEINRHFFSKTRTVTYQFFLLFWIE